MQCMACGSYLSAMACNFGCPNCGYNEGWDKEIDPSLGENDDRQRKVRQPVKKGREVRKGFTSNEKNNNSRGIITIQEQSTPKHREHSSISNKKPTADATRK